MDILNTKWLEYRRVEVKGTLSFFYILKSKDEVLCSGVFALGGEEGVQCVSCVKKCM